MADEPVQLQISICTRKYSNMGDHAERSLQYHVHEPGETLEHLVYRLFPELSSQFMTFHPDDQIILQIVLGSDGEPTGKAVPATPDPAVPPPF